jgi:hypothetical protein
MARGFESKDVEYQQEAADRGKGLRRALTPEERAARTERQTLELALARTRADRDAARSAVHRTMLDRAVADLEARLQRIK